MQRRPNVFDVGPTLYKCDINILCLLAHPTVITPDNAPALIPDLIQNHV